MNSFLVTDRRHVLSRQDEEDLDEKDCYGFKVKTELSAERGEVGKLTTPDAF